jgi:hypothetical protein
MFHDASDEQRVAVVGTSPLGNHPCEEFAINSSRVEDGQVQTFDSSQVAKSLRNVFQGGISARPRSHRRPRPASRPNDANRLLGSPLLRAVLLPVVRFSARPEVRA